MSQPQWARTDDELLAALRDALNGAPVFSPQTAAAAKASFAWRTVDEDLELLSLVTDSAVESTAGVRGSSDLRLLDFSSVDLSLEVEVSRGFVMGQLIPMQPAHVMLSTVDGTYAETDADATGTFRLPRPAGGTIRLLCRTAGAQLVTEWTSL